MRNQVKIYTSVFFLFLFLLPIIGKGIHTHPSIGESHYFSSEKQFSAQEDHCFICDFISVDSNSPIPVNNTNLVSETYFSYRHFVEDIFLQDAFLHLSPRAPPIA
jgi:hypothetical protein